MQTRRIEEKTLYSGALPEYLSELEGINAAPPTVLPQFGETEVQGGYCWVLVALLHDGLTSRCVCCEAAYTGWLAGWLAWIGREGRGGG